MRRTIQSSMENEVFFHEHKYSKEDEKWHENDVINTRSFPKRSFSCYEEPLKYFAEKDYENVRSQSFRECPSRLTCAFFFRNLSDARIFFYSIFCRAQILSVRLLQGKLIACDQNIINKYLDGTQQQRKDEYEYWDVLLRIHCGNFFLKDVFR